MRGCGGQGVASHTAGADTLAEAGRADDRTCRTLGAVDEVARGADGAGLRVGLAALQTVVDGSAFDAVGPNEDVASALATVGAGIVSVAGQTDVAGVVGCVQGGSVVARFAEGRVVI